MEIRGLKIDSISRDVKVEGIPICEHDIVRQVLTSALCI